MHGHCQNSISQGLIWALSWNFKGILKGEDYLTKRQYVHNTVNTTATATFNTTTIACVSTTCTAKSIEMKLSRSI